MLKRQMYGRARPDLLRKRVLLADWPDHGNCARATFSRPRTKSALLKPLTSRSCCHLTRSLLMRLSRR